ncbi:MAG TPA: helix-turn-helix domain-containing protein [Burkholderiaceae bacterium]|jgi:transcriptional regulator GlxA family with amidase domain
MKIIVFALDGVFDSGLTVLLDALGLANKFAAGQKGGSLSFEVSIVGVRKKVRTAHGLLVPVNAVPPESTPDWVVVPALSTSTPELLVPALDRRDVIEAKEHLRSWHAQGAHVAASCIGTFLLADAGLLNGGQATTTWWLGPLFRQRYPEVELDESRMLVPSGRCVTAGAAMGHLDLALWLIREASPELAALVSRYLLADLRSSQAPYIIPNHLAQADPAIQRFERWARDHLKSGFSLDEAASALATSPRTLQRRCQAVLGKSPLAYFQDLRVERARSLVHGSNLDLDSIAAEVGYVDGATLGTLLRDRLGRGVRELRGELR